MHTSQRTLRQHLVNNTGPRLQASKLQHHGMCYELNSVIPRRGLIRFDSLTSNFGAGAGSLAGNMKQDQRAEASEHYNESGL